MNLVHNKLRRAPFIVGFTAGVILTAAGGPQPRMRFAEPDIRETFLSVPISQEDLEYFEVAREISDSGQRKALLEKTDFTSGDNVLDVPNGYLRIAFTITPEDNPRRRQIVVTYFTKRNRDRLVVVQLARYEYPDPDLGDGFYLFANAKYTQQQASQYLPPISFFGDFWGNQPLPDQRVREYAKSIGDRIFYDIDWPRQGSVARARSYVPYSDTDTPERNRVERILGRRQFKEMELIWDKDKGVFVKGAKTRDHR